MLEPTGELPQPAVPRSVGTVFYGNHGVYVTDQLFVCGGRKIALARLSHVHTVRAPVPGTTINAAIAAGTVAVVLVIAGSLLDAKAWFGALVVLAIPVTVVLVGLIRRRPYELWADCTGGTGGELEVTRVLLLRVSDRERYHQICRAIVRAQEHSRF